MSRVEGLYLRLPILMQNVICSVEGWRIRNSRFGPSFQQALSETESRSHYSIDQITEYRNRCLQAYIQYAALTVPYYRRLFKARRLDPRSIRTLEDLEQLPILTKSDVQQNLTELLSEVIPKAKRRIIHTSGTTGSGLRFATTSEAIEKQWAVWWRYRQWHGLRQGTVCGYFGGRSVVPLNQQEPPFWRHNIPGRQILFSAYHMSPKNLPAYISALRKLRPLWLHGYPSLLALIASYIVEGQDGLGYTPYHITVGAENLTAQQKQLIEKAFGTKPIQHYGLAEAVANISECSEGNLHIDEDFSAVELVPSNDGNSHRVIGTNFTNYATPLIRYDTQDLVNVDDSLSCNCGCPGRLVKDIDGRKEDYIVLSNGARLGRMDHIFKDLINIREAQLFQKRPGHIEIRIVRGAQYSEVDEVSLLREMYQRVGSNTEITINYKEYLERSRTGKLRFVVSEIQASPFTPIEKSYRN